MCRRRTSTASINERNMYVEKVNRRPIYRAAAATDSSKTTTLHRQVTDPTPERDIKITLTVKEEELLVSFLMKFAYRGVPLSKNHFKEAIEIFVNRMDPTRRLILPVRFWNPGRAFLRGFEIGAHPRSRFQSPCEKRPTALPLSTTRFWQHTLRFFISSLSKTPSTPAAYVTLMNPRWLPNEKCLVSHLQRN